MINLKSEKGSITVFVLASCMFFIAAVTCMQMYMQSKQIAVDREYRQIKANYEKDIENINDIYNQLSQTENLPVYFSIPTINETEKNISISVSLTSEDVNIDTIKYGWIKSTEEITPSSSDISDWVYVEDTNSPNRITANKKYTDDMDYYYLCVMINNKEFWPKAPVKVSGDASYYGDAIDYDIDLGNNADGEPLNIVGTADYDWEIFYNDGTNIYIIAEDYVPLVDTNGLMPTVETMKNNLSEVVNKPYGLYWEYSANTPTGRTGVSDIFGSTATQGTVYLADKYLANWKEAMVSEGATKNLSGQNENKNANAKITATLMDTRLWSDFANSTKVKELTSRPIEFLSIGQPTLEMWVKSWNQKHGNLSMDENKSELYYVADETGYYIGTSENPSQKNVKVDNSDPLYYPHTNIYKSCRGYWLTSPSTNDFRSVMYVQYDGLLNFYFYNNSSASARPIVCLPSDITAQWNQKDQIWNIVKK